MSATTSTKPDSFRYLIVGVLVLGAFFGAYRFAVAQESQAQTQQPGFAAFADPGAAGAAGGAGCDSCGSCGSAPTEDGVSGERLEADATVEGDAQSISVDQSVGYYQPNVVRLKAGMPTQITFGQGAGCTAQVMSKELGFFIDVTGGPETVELPALEPGEYPFYCGMQMLYGKIIVE